MHRFIGPSELPNIAEMAHSLPEILCLPALLRSNIRGEWWSLSTPCMIALVQR